MESHIWDSAFFSFQIIIHTIDEVKKEVITMLESFLAFNVNGINYFIYMITSNFWLFLILIGMAGTIILQLKEEVDTAVREEQNII